MNTEGIDQAVQAKYLSSSSVCPVCEGENIESTENVQVDSDIAWQSILCKDCHSTWTDIYILTGIDDLVDNLHKGEVDGKEIKGPGDCHQEDSPPKGQTLHG